MYTDYKQEDLFAELHIQRQNYINGRNVWLYLLSSSIGNIAVVDYEQPGLEIKRKLFDENYDKAEAYFEAVCHKIVSGKM